MKIISAVLAIFLSAPLLAADQPWVGEVRTGNAGISAESLCKKIEALKYREAPERTESIALAKDILNVFKMPVWAREKAVPCGVPGKDKMLYLTQTGRLMDILVATLDRAGAKPQDIQMTSAGLRKVFLADVKAQVAHVRKGFENFEGSMSDYYGPRLSETAGEAITNWGFTAKEIGLTPDEVKMLAK